MQNVDNSGKSAYIERGKRTLGQPGRRYERGITICQTNRMIYRGLDSSGPENGQVKSS